MNFELAIEPGRRLAVLSLPVRLTSGFQSLSRSTWTRLAGESDSQLHFAICDSKHNRGKMWQLQSPPTAAQTDGGRGDGTT